ncbi:hypothetical protein QR680_005376 [Steinernema hermaphroditum]|uniref:Uncharacterized protein n=1 Tax=Steinernema hermaphroditum TaxID=289476 RepID=A0AA39HT02_9BILA|nr:hypothetical protein QR680_005376 [Steinernema hermaphroditum]
MQSYISGTTGLAMFNSTPSAQEVLNRRTQVYTPSPTESLMDPLMEDLIYQQEHPGAAPRLRPRFFESPRQRNEDSTETESETSEEAEPAPEMEMPAIPWDQPPRPDKLTKEELELLLLVVKLPAEAARTVSFDIQREIQVLAEYTEKRIQEETLEESRTAVRESPPERSLLESSFANFNIVELGREGNELNRTAPALARPSVMDLIDLGSSPSRMEPVTETVVTMRLGVNEARDILQRVQEPNPPENECTVLITVKDLERFRRVLARFLQESPMLAPEIEPLIRYLQNAEREAAEQGMIEG